MGGDFNEFCYDREKIGGNLRLLHQTRAFMEVLQDCYLQDLHGTGEFFTWVNRRDNDNLIFERLDRYVGSLAWRLLYPAAQVQSLKFYSLDHRPIHLELKASLMQHSSHNRPFRFEPHWVTEMDCTEVVEQGWGNHENSLLLPHIILRCKNESRCAGNRFK